MDQEERSELVRRLFAQMTSKLEDAAADAAHGQAKGIDERQQIERAERISISSSRMLGGELRGIAS